MPTLPALKSLGDLASVRPTIVVDTREQTPLVFTRLPAVRGTLFSGDYSVKGLEAVFAVERKTIGDLTACCTASARERFEHELHRLRGYRFKRLLIVGDRHDIEAGAYRSNIRPAAVMGSLQAWEVRFDIPVVFEADAASAARRVEGWSWYFAREAIGLCNDLLRTTPTPTATHTD